MQPDKPMFAGDASYNRALEALKARANDPDVTIQFFDSNRPGSKDGQCNLGLCDEEIEAQADGDYFRDGRHTCPHDARYFDGKGNRITPPEGTNILNGCFYTCRIFSPSKTMLKRARAERIYLARQRIRNATLIPVELVAETPIDDVSWED